MIRITAVLIIAGVCLYTGAVTEAMQPAPGRNSAGINLKAYGSMLEQLVDARGQVAYRGFQQHPGFDMLIEQIAHAKPATMSENERLAFYINAYNLLVIKNVIDHYPIASPMDVKGFFKSITFNVGGKHTTLDNLEYKLIVPLGGPYVHFGIVCAAKSCPRLIRKPYTATNVRNLLKENAARFLQDQSKNRLDRGENTLYLSELFKWFRKDFSKKAGSVRAFVLPHLSASDREYIQTHEISIDYLPYSWKLNAQ